MEKFVKPSKKVDGQRTFHKYFPLSINDLIKDNLIDENLQYDEFLEGAKENQQLLAEL